MKVTTWTQQRRMNYALVAFTGLLASCCSFSIRNTDDGYEIRFWMKSLPTNIPTLTHPFRIYGKVESKNLGYRAYDCETNVLNVESSLFRNYIEGNIVSPSDAPAGDPYDLVSTKLNPSFELYNPKGQLELEFFERVGVTNVPIRRIAP